MCSVCSVGEVGDELRLGRKKKPRLTGGVYLISVSEGMYVYVCGVLWLVDGGRGGGLQGILTTLEAKAKSRETLKRYYFRW